MPNCSDKGYVDYNEAVKHRKEYEVTIYDFDRDLYCNIPEWAHPGIG